MHYLNAKRCTLGPQNVIWGLKNGGKGGRPGGNGNGSATEGRYKKVLRNTVYRPSYCEISSFCVQLHSGNH